MSKELTTPQAQVPEHIKKHKGETGAEDMGPENIVISRLKICQGSSNIHEVNGDIKDGQLYDSVSGEVVGMPINFFVMTWWLSKVWFSADLKLRCVQFRHPVTKQMVEFGNEKEECLNGPEPEDPKLKPKDSHNYMIILERDVKTAIESKQLPMPMIYSAMSAAIKGARQLNGKIKTNSLKSVPIYGQLVTMETRLESFKVKPAYMPAFKFTRFADANEFKFLQAFYGKCRELLGRGEVHDPGMGSVEDDIPEGPPPEKPSGSGQQDIPF